MIHIDVDDQGKILRTWYCLYRITLYAIVNILKSRIILVKGMYLQIEPVLGISYTPQYVYSLIILIMSLCSLQKAEIPVQ